MQNVVVTGPQYEKHGMDEQDGIRIEDMYLSMDGLATSVHLNPDAPVRLQDFSAFQERISKVEERIFETENEVTHINNAYQSGWAALIFPTNTIRKSKVGMGIFIVTLAWIYTYVIVGSLQNQYNSLACLNTDPNRVRSGYVMGSIDGLLLYMPSQNGFRGRTFYLSNFTFTTARQGDALQEVTPDIFEVGRDHDVGLSKGVSFYISRTFNSIRACHVVYHTRAWIITFLTMTIATCGLLQLFQFVWCVVLPSNPMSRRLEKMTKFLFNTCAVNIQKRCKKIGSKMRLICNK